MSLYKIIKVVLCGPPGVGKTSLLRRFVNDPGEPFLENQRSTIGVDFKTVQVVSKKTSNTIRFQVWDTAGQERFKAVSKAYFRGAHIFVFVYDVSKKASLEEARDWLGEAEWTKSEKTGAYECVHTPSAVAFLVANKCDVSVERREISYAEGDAFAASYGMACFETSAKSGAGVLGMFQSFADMMDEHVLEYDEEDDERTIQLQQQIEFLDKSKKTCC
jgi:small GTP-binding protein